MCSLDNDIRYNEIKNFFDEYMKLNIEKYEENFLNHILSSYSCSINNITLSNYSNYDIKYLSRNTYEIATFFKDDKVYYIFQEIKKLLINKTFIVQNISQVLNDNYDEIKRINNNIQSILYKFSLNKQLFEIFTKYNNNYKKLIEENNEYNNFINKYENIINNYDYNYTLKINNYQNKQDFTTNNINNYLIYYHIEKKFIYEDYLKIYNFLHSYINNLDDIEIMIQSHEILKKPINNKKKINKKDNVKETTKNDLKETTKKDDLKETSKKEAIKETTKKEAIKETNIKDDIKETTTKDNVKEINKKDNIKETNKKDKKKSIPLSLKRNVWNKYIGEAIGKTLCLCCKLTEISQLNFSCGHIISEFNGGKVKLDNLKPICVSCNSSIGTRNMNDFIEEYGL